MDHVVKMCLPFIRNEGAGASSGDVGRFIDELPERWLERALLWLDPREAGALRNRSLPSHLRQALAINGLRNACDPAAFAEAMASLRHELETGVSPRE